MPFGSKSQYTPPKPKKVLPAKALGGKSGHAKGSGTDFETLRVYDERKAPKITGADLGSIGKGRDTNFPTGSSTYTGATSGVSGSGGSSGGYGGGSGASGFANLNAGPMPGGYTPAGYQTLMTDHPDAAAQDFLAGLGIDNSQLTDQFTPLYQELNALTSFLGADAAGELLSAPGQANQNNAYLTQLTTPGGQALDPAAIMEAIANADPSSASGMALSAMTPEQVVNFAMALMESAGGNPFQARGIQAGLDKDARDYNIGLAKMEDPLIARPYWQNLQSGPLGSFFGG